MNNIVKKSYFYCFFNKTKEFILTLLASLLKDYEIILASQSPRRINLLKSLNINFKIEPADINEDIYETIPPKKYVKILSSEKVKKIALSYKNTSKIIIGADTIVVFNKHILNKPIAELDAFKMLKKLSGHYHFVYTGIALFNTKSEKLLTDISRTCVYFRKLDEREIINYISTGKPLDKAGGYGIQDDYGALFVKKIEGCYNNVIGLPLELLWKNLLKIC